MRKLLSNEKGDLSLGICRSVLGLLSLGLALVLPSEAAARGTIKEPGERPSYAFEAEPQFSLGVFNPPGWGRAVGLGGGFRGTVEIAKDGFIPKLNDSVGISFGLDYLSYDHAGDPRGRCERFVMGPNATRICVEVSGGGARQNYFIAPVAMQWNFWLTEEWSVFGEPGFFLYMTEGDVEFSPFGIYAGGRYHFAEGAALTMRLGYPAWSLGISFFL